MHGDWELLTEDVFAEYDRKYDEVCASIKAEIRQQILSSVPPEEIPPAQFQRIRAESIADAERKIEKAFYNLKLLNRCGGSIN